MSLELLTEQLEIADELRAGRSMMFEPQQLPGRYGRAVRAIDQILNSLGCEAVLGGGWAVWRHGYLGRVTQDIDIALPRNRVEEFLRVAAISGFELLAQPPGRWPKLRHKDSGIEVDILPEGGRPGTTARPAPTTIAHPSALGASGTRLAYMNLESLVELKLAAGRARDESDIIELVRANMGRTDELRAHLEKVYPGYAAAFDQLVERAREQQDQ